MASRPQVGRDRGACLARAQLPGLRRLVPDPGGEAGGHGRHAGAATLSCRPSRRPFLVLGTDVRPSGCLAAPGEDTPQKCIDAAGEGKTPPSTCSPYRADTIMLIRAGGRRLSQALDPARHASPTIPGHDAEQDQRAPTPSAAPSSTVQTRSSSSWASNVDQVAIVDFDGFRDFIDAIGGVDRGHRPEGLLGRSRAERGMAASASTSIPGEHDAGRATEAISLDANAREPARRSAGQPVPLRGNDIDRAKRQQP